jgi:hypothetical protein
VSPPNAPGVPGTKLPQATQEIVRKRANSHADSEPPESEADRQSLVDFNEAVHARVGKASFHGPAWALLVTLFVGMLGGIVYLATRHQEQQMPAQCLTKDDFERSMRDRDERLARRLDTLETDTSYLKVAVRLVQDRLPPSK